ncbi:ThiamineS/Molybdopterin converting factor subunit 1 [Corchorus olitorius]|uniref:ThiamineS/Molybdopterin converting factor subunit 1 n=1 Tax=Corchorus olitorius TaxID=93759 RepID=A0A1R3I4J6_9ROSI|nr:ThiamineS/Molybdopterin converting factor subunit 1 [Corchorus olitorius]
MMESESQNNSLVGTPVVDEASSVQIKVLFFAKARDITGLPELPLVVSPGSTTEDCLNKLVAKFPNLQDIRGCIVLALNEEYTTESAIVKDKDELAIIPPISDNMRHWAIGSKLGQGTFISTQALVGRKLRLRHSSRLERDAFRPTLFLGRTLIEKTCRQTPFYELCLWSLKSHPESRDADDVKKLTQIMVDSVLKTKAMDTLDLIDELLQDGIALEPAMQRALTSCAERYNAIIKGDVPEIVEALKTGDYKFAEKGSNDAAMEANSYHAS